MRLGFASNKLKRTMESEAALKRAYGTRAGAIKRRLAILDSAKCLADVPRVPPDRCHELTGDRAGQFAVMVSGNDRLLFEPDHDPVPQLDDGGIDLKGVNAITIVSVEDYHGR